MIFHFSTDRTDDIIMTSFDNPNQTTKIESTIHHYSTGSHCLYWSMSL